MAIVSNDSDMMVYEGVPTVTMQRGRGKSREFRTYRKTVSLSVLSLPLDKHLLLASILTKNDYFAGISWYGIRRISKIAEDIDPDDMSLEDGLKKCLGRILRCMATEQGLMHALDALARCQE
ncbi:hypothetical protein EDD11_007719 [Mortierella claussenii]|nr:hypothetical protein EDD11_007719 [Mortierella claussenii]